MVPAGEAVVALGWREGGGGGKKARERCVSVCRDGARERRDRQGVVCGGGCARERCVSVVSPGVVRGKGESGMVVGEDESSTSQESGTREPLLLVVVVVVG